MANIKTAISIQDTLFEQVEQLASDLKVPRSRIFALAVEEYLKRQENLRLLAKINEAYEDAPDTGEQTRLGQMKASQRRILEGEW
ncbi:MAG: hypothetical protein ACOYLN_02695 [Blastocatellia bacterium]|jgi:predicted transcriptional regulator